MRLTTQKGFSGINESMKLQNAPESASYMKNYRVTESGSITRRADYITLLSNLSGNIEGMWSGTIGETEMIVYACAGVLWRILTNDTSMTPERIGMIEYGECMMFEFNGVLYIKTAGYYGKYDGNVLTEVEGYIPTVAISCAASGEGVLNEQINLICDKRRQLFSADGSSRLYKLAESGVDSIISIKLDGVDYEYEYALNAAGDGVAFQTTLTEGLNNLEIIYSKSTSESDRKRIMGCTKVILFGGNSDGRAFLWGNPDYPNYRFHSDLADGVPSVEYFPVNAFTVIGNSKINCIVQQYDRQLIFNENEAYYSYCELREDTLGNVISSFPVYSLNNGKGCLFEMSGCVIDNRPVTLCNDGLNMWESTSVQNEKNAVCFSSAINESIKNILSGEKGILHLFDFQANRELYFICDNIAYIYNYGSGSWYMFDTFGMDKYTVFGTTLYFSRGRSLYAYANHLGENTELERIWESNYITGGHGRGRVDIIGFEADLYVKGPVQIQLSIEKSGGGDPLIHEYRFDESEDRYMRISLRPAIKRAMPFRINIRETGSGSSTLHGMSIITREKERSSRYGILGQY